MSDFIQEPTIEAPENEKPQSVLKLRWFIIPVLVVALLTLVAACAGPAVGNTFSNIVSTL